MSILVCSHYWTPTICRKSSALGGVIVFVVECKDSVFTDQCGSQSGQRRVGRVFGAEQCGEFALT